MSPAVDMVEYPACPGCGTSFWVVGHRGRWPASDRPAYDCLGCGQQFDGGGDA